MFSHVMLGASNLDKSRQFYDALLGALGAGPGVTDPKNRTFWRHAGNTFAITAPINGEPASHGNGATLGFAAQSPEQVNADPYGEGWLVKIKLSDVSEVEDLMDATTYEGSLS